MIKNPYLGNLVDNDKCATCSNTKTTKRGNQRICGECAAAWDKSVAHWQTLRLAELLNEKEE